MNLKIPILILNLGLVLGFGTAFEGGSGSSRDPYQISTCQQLQDMEDDLFSSYELANNIECNVSESWNSLSGFNPVGSDNSNKFYGSLNGNGYTVSNLYIDRGSKDFVGLFGFTAESAVVKNFKMNDVNIEGATYTGSAVGYSQSNVTDIEISGIVSGTDNVGGVIGYISGGFVRANFTSGEVSGNDKVGGLIGYDYGLGSGNFPVNRSYSGGKVTGDGRVGGLIGETYASEVRNSFSFAAVDVSSSAGGGLIGNNDGDLYDSYSTGTVTGGDSVGGLIGYNENDVFRSYTSSYVSGGSDVGGLIGLQDQYDGTITDSYWDINASNISTGNGTGLTTSDMVGSAAGSNMSGFDFQDTWSTQSFYYSRLQWMELGSGAEADPFMIYNCRELQALRNNLTAHYELANDIDCSDTENWDNGQGFRPIGDDSSHFQGSLDGKDFDIYDLVIDRDSEYWVGLFGYIDTSHSVTDFRLIDVDVTADQIVGALAGDVQAGSISRVGIEGNVTGISFNTGGLIGIAEFSASLNQSYVRGNVTGGQDVGGIAGQFDGLIENSYSWANVTGEDDTGGFAGYSDGGRYIKSYSAGEVDGPDSFEIQGFVGDHRGSGDDFESAYWDKNTSGRDGVWGATGLTTSQMTGEACDMDGFDGQDWNFFTEEYPQLNYFTTGGISRNCETSNPPLAPTLLIPSDGSTQVPVTTNLSVTAEGSGLQDITFYWNDSGGDTEIGSISDINASASETAQIEWSGLNTSTNYAWYAVAENSDGSANSSSWSFTTEDKPVIDSFEPGHDSTTEPNPELKINVSDDISDDIEVRFYSSSDQLLETASGLQSGDQAVYDPSLISFGSTPGQTYEWYAVVETDSGASVNSSEASGFEDYWRFTPQSLIGAEIEVEFGDQVNVNNGSADIGRTDLEFKPWNPSTAVMDNVIVDVDGSQVENFSDVASNSTQIVDISTLGLSEDQTYSWSVSVEDSGSEVGSFSGEFSTHTVDIEAVPQDGSHDSINLYYSEDGSSFSRLDSFTRSDDSSLSIKAANLELYQANSHCYTAATSRAGLESSKSPEVCIGGDVP